MLHDFFLDVYGRYKLDWHLREAALERLRREAKRRQPRQEPSEHTGGLKQACAGVLYRTLVSGPRLMVTEMFYRQHANTPVHSHPSEQAGYILSGRLRLTVGGQERTVGAGDVYLIPAAAPHCLRALEAAAVVDVFSPPREDYLEPVDRSEPDVQGPAPSHSDRCEMAGRGGTVCRSS